MTPRRAVLGPIGGESPIRFLHEAALRIAAGDSEAALVVGAEAEYTVGLARKEGVQLAWAERDDTPVVRGTGFMHPQAVLHGVATPATAYQLFENAALSTWGQTPAQAHAESAALWEQYGAVAAANPYSWRTAPPMQAEEIARPTPENRIIAHPYTKSMIANPMVNQGAAVLVTSLARARAAGIPEDKLVYFFGGAAADEPRDYLERARLDGVARGRRRCRGFFGNRVVQLFPDRAQDRRADTGAAGVRGRTGADGDRRVELFRGAAEQLHDARRGVDGAAPARCTPRSGPVIRQRRFHVLPSCPGAHSRA
jgi:acetyl-CoA C-acetyltransferase